MHRKYISLAFLPVLAAPCYAQDLLHSYAGDSRPPELPPLEDIMIPDRPAILEPNWGQVRGLELVPAECIDDPELPACNTAVAEGAYALIDPSAILELQSLTQEQEELARVGYFFRTTLKAADSISSTEYCESLIRRLFDADVACSARLNEAKGQIGADIFVRAEKIAESPPIFVVEVTAASRELSRRYEEGFERYIFRVIFSFRDEDSIAFDTVNLLSYWIRTADSVQEARDPKFEGELPEYIPSSEDFDLRSDIRQVAADLYQQHVNMIN